MAKCRSVNGNGFVPTFGTEMIVAFLLELLRVSQCFLKTRSMLTRMCPGGRLLTHPDIAWVEVKEDVIVIGIFW